MIEVAENFIRENYQKLGLSCAPSKVSFVKMGGRQDRFGSVPFACFLDNKSHPTFYVKFPRDPANPERVKVEFDNLHEIRKIIRSGTITTSIPVPLWYNNSPVFTVQSAMVGVPLLSEMSGRSFPKYSRLVLAWLTEFHEKTKTRGVVYQKYAHKKIAEMERDIGAYSKSAGRIFSNAIALTIKGLKTGRNEIPLTRIHSDFNPHNILFDGKNLAVFDWEESSIDLPFIDVFHYFTVSSFSVEFSRHDRKLSKENRYRKYFLENMEKILLTIRNNYSTLAIDENLFAPTYIFYLAHMAANEIRRDRLINYFELWANMLKMFVAEVA